MVVETRDCASLTDTDLDELANMGGAFDIGVGDAAAAWGFGPEAAADARIRAALAATRRPCWEVLEIEEDRVRKQDRKSTRLNSSHT